MLTPQRNAIRERCVAMCQKHARLLVNTLKRLLSAFSGETEGFRTLLTLGSILFWLIIPPVLAVAQTNLPPADLSGVPTGIANNEVWRLTLRDAIATEPPENLPPRVLRTAEMIAVRSQVEELVKLRSAPKPDDIRELRLAQRLQGVVIASALDVESVNARIDYETAHLQEVQVYLSARRDRRVDLLNLGNLFIGGGVGAIGSGLQLFSSAEHAGNVVGTSAGFGGTLLSVIGLQQQKGQLRSPEYTPAMLAKLLGNSPPDSSDYPQEVWVYLTTPDPTLPHGSTGQEHLVSEWTRFGHLKEKPDPKTMAALTTTGKDGTKLSIEMIGERTAMLADLRAHVSTMLVDLADLMMLVAQQK